MLRGEVWRGARQARRSRAAGLCSLKSMALYGWFSRARVFPPFWFGRLIGSTLSQRDQFDMRRVGIMVQRRSSRCVHTHSDDAANQNIASKTGSTRADYFCLDLDGPLFVTIFLSICGELRATVDFDRAWRTRAVLSYRSTYTCIAG